MYIQTKNMIQSLREKLDCILFNQCRLPMSGYDSTRPHQYACVPIRPLQQDGSLSHQATSGQPAIWFPEEGSP